MQTESSLSLSLQRLSLHSLPTPQETTRQEQVAKLVQLGITDETGKVFQESPLRIVLPEELMLNAQDFLDAKRIGNTTLRSILQTISAHLKGKCFAPVAMGDELKSLLGWEFLQDSFMQLVHSKDPSVQLSDCLSYECQQIIRAECQKSPQAITIRFQLFPNVDRQAAVDVIHNKLGAGFSPPLHIDDDRSNTHFSTFSLDSQVNNTSQKIHFTFVTNATPNAMSTDALQLGLDDNFLNMKTTPVILSNNQSNQWCVDTMYKTTRIAYPGKKMAKLLFNYVRNGFELSKEALAILKQELFEHSSALVDFWSRSTGDKAANALFLCQLCNKLGAEDAIDPFLKKVQHTEDTSLWNICVRLLANNTVSYNDLMCMLQVLGIGASVCSSTAITTESFVYLSGFKVPLQLDEAMDTFATLPINHDLIEALYKPPFCKNTTPALQKLVIESNRSRPYLQILILSLLPEHGHFLELALAGYTENMRTASPQERHSYETLFKALSVIHDFEFPQSLQNGNVQLETMESSWAECLLQSKSVRCIAVGKKLLLALKGYASSKLRWMTHHPDIALTIINQIQNDEVVTARHVTQWLQQPYKKRVWELLVTSTSQRWMRFCVATCPEQVTTATLPKDTLVKALKIKDALQDDFTAAVLPVVCSRWALDNAPDAIRPVLERLTSRNRAFVESTLKEFVGEALATKNQTLAVAFMKTYLRLQCKGFDDQDKKELLRCMKEPHEKDAVLWFMEIVKSAVGSAFMADDQVELYLHFAATQKSFVQEDHQKYIHALYSTLEDSQKTALKTRIMAFIASHHKLSALLEKVFINFLRWQQQKVAVVTQAVTGICELGLSTPPERALVILKSQDTDTTLSKADKSHLRSTHEAFIGRAIETQEWELALRFMKVCMRHGLNLARPQVVLQCMQTDLPEDLIRWYLSLRGNFIAYKVEPVSQLRTFLHLAKTRPHLLSKEDDGYISELKKRTINQIPADLQAEIEEANIPQFAPFCVQKKEKVVHVLPANELGPADTIEALIREGKPILAAENLLNCPITAEYQALVLPCINGLLDLNPADPNDQIFQLLAKFCTHSSREWLSAFNTLQSNLASHLIAKNGLHRLLACTEMPEHVSRVIWQTIFKNGQWLQYTEALCVLEHLNFFKTLLWNEKKSLNMLADTLAFFVVVLEKPDQDREKYLPLLHTWFSLVPQAHAARLEVGLRLLGFCTPTDTPEVVQRSCVVVIGLCEQLEKALSAKKTRPLEPVLARLQKFIASTRTAPADSEKALCTLVSTLGKLAIPAVHEFVVTECTSNSTLAVKEAMWASCKHQLNNSTKVEVKSRAEKVVHELLESQDAEILLEVYARRFKADDSFFLVHAQEKTVPHCYPEYTKYYERLLQLCIESRDPAHSNNALAIDIVISNHYPNQSKDIRCQVGDYVTLRLKLMLRQIQYHGFNEMTQSRIKGILINFGKEQVFKNLATSKEQVFGLQPLYVYANHPRFYTYSQKMHTNKLAPGIFDEKESVGSLYPECSGAPGVKDEMTCLYTMLYAALGFAAKSRHIPEQRNRLLDFVVQTLRNLVEHHTHVVFNYDCISLLARALAPDDPIFDAHGHIIADLVRATVRKGIVTATCQEVQEALSYVNKPLTESNPKMLGEIARALDHVTKDNVVEVLVSQQKLLLMWQERFFVGDYQGRQLIIDALFNVWRKHPIVTTHPSTLRSMSDVMLPTSVRFGINDGAVGKKAASLALVSYFDCYIDLYKDVVKQNKNFYVPAIINKKMSGQAVSKEGTAAQHYLETIAVDFHNTRITGAYDEDYDTFLELAYKIMGLFRFPCYVDLQIFSQAHETFITTLLAPAPHAQDRKKQALAVHEWLEVIKSHKSGSFLRDMVGRVRKSGIWLFFTMDHLRDFVELLDDAGRSDLYKTIQRDQFVAPTLSTECMHRLYIIAASYHVKDKAQKSLTPQQCVGAMMYFFQKFEASIEYTQFIQYAMHIALPLVGPSYIDLDDIRKYATSFLTTVLKKPCPKGQESLRAMFIYEWLVVVMSQKESKEALFADLLNEAMTKFIEANCFSAFAELRDKENAMLDACYKNWLETSKPDEPLIASYQRQTAFKRIQEAFANVETELDKVLEQLEL
ncbi:MAG: hypothetical protein LLF94_04650 [Chlamydiales bacterium]|nr:hypothetical protein [Chlamydiales bacterium]